MTWKDVSTRPAHDDWVLVWDGLLWRVARFDGGDWVDTEDLSLDPTHWQSLPDAPPPSCSKCVFAKKEMCVHPVSLTRTVGDDLFQAHTQELMRSIKTCAPEGRLFREPCDALERR